MIIDLEELIVELKKQDIEMVFYGSTGVELKSNQKIIGICKNTSLESSLATIIAKLSKQKIQTTQCDSLSIL